MSELSETLAGILEKLTSLQRQVNALASEVQELHGAVEVHIESGIPWGEEYEEE